MTFSQATRKTVAEEGNKHEIPIEQDRASLPYMNKTFRTERHELPRITRLSYQGCETSAPKPQSRTCLARPNLANYLISIKATYYETGQPKNYDP